MTIGPDRRLPSGPDHLCWFNAMNDVTPILSAIEQGDPKAAEELLPLVYDELRRLAAQRLAQEKPGQTLQATALVHEAYLRVVDGEKVQQWDSQRHFFAAAAEAMRRILIDQARRKQSAKAGGARERVALENGPSLVAPEGTPAEDLLALDEALRQLEPEDPVKAELVKLRFFAGVSLEDAARMLDVSPATAKRYWVYARSWLYGQLRGE
jgi:RNA polymerase sigma factor (TIGR02999 family)